MRAFVGGVLASFAFCTSLLVRRAEMRELDLAKQRAREKTDLAVRLGSLKLEDASTRQTVVSLQHQLAFLREQQKTDLDLGGGRVAIATLQQQLTEVMATIESWERLEADRACARLRLRGQGPLITVVSSAMSARSVFFNNLLQNFQRQTYPNKEFIVFGNAMYSDCPPLSELSTPSQNYSRCCVL